MTVCLGAGGWQTFGETYGCCFAHSLSLRRDREQISCSLRRLRRRSRPTTDVSGILENMCSLKEMHGTRVAQSRCLAFFLLSLSPVPAVSRSFLPHFSLLFSSPLASLSTADEDDWAPTDFDYDRE
uniref:Uncharacterized protein n=1 Tax=Plectus sambesii TaxID=2011161 RepID=A0A914WQ51_9BILA